MILKKDAEIDMDRESKQWENIKGNGNKKGIIHRIRNRQLKFIGSTREEGLENFSLKGHIRGQWKEAGHLPEKLIWMDDWKMGRGLTKVWIVDKGYEGWGVVESNEGTRYVEEWINFAC